MKIHIDVIKVPQLFCITEKLETQKHVTNSVDRATSLRAEIFYKVNLLASFVNLHGYCIPVKTFQLFLTFFVSGTCNAGNEFSVSIKFPTFLEYLIASHIEVCSMV
jgi:hypothetical protein